MIFIVNTPILIVMFLPRDVKSITAFANAANDSYTACLSNETEFAIGTGLQYIILKPFW